MSGLPRYLGAYAIEGQIGAGGMGTVFGGWHQLLGRRVALKVRYCSTEPEEELLAERFRQGAILQAQLDHPNIARVYDYIETKQMQVIVMELLSGVSVEDRLHQCGGPMPFDEAIAVGIQATAAIDYAHHKGVIHRDIKPGNLLLVDADDTMNIRMSDFGVAKTLDRSPDLTMAGTNVGTLWYMPPEQFNNEEPTTRVDVYALGATLYEMFTGHIPYRAAQHAEIFRRFLDREPPPPMRERNPNIPEALAEVIEAALELEPEERIPSAGAFSALLRAVAEVQVVPVGGGEHALSLMRRCLQVAAQHCGRFSERVRTELCDALTRLHTQVGGLPEEIWSRPSIDDDDTTTGRHYPVVEFSPDMHSALSSMLDAPDTLSFQSLLLGGDDDEDSTVVMDQPTELPHEK